MAADISRPSHHSESHCDSFHGSTPHGPWVPLQDGGEPAHGEDSDKAQAKWRMCQRVLLYMFACVPGCICYI